MSSRPDPEGLRRRARAMQALAWVFAVALPALATTALALQSEWTFGPQSSVPVDALPPTVALAAATIGLVPVLLMSWALLQLARCFARIAAGEFLALPVVTKLRAFAGWAAASGFASIAATPLASAIVTQAAGQGAVTVSVGSGPISVLFVAGATWIVSALIERGALVDAELDAFV